MNDWVRFEFTDSSRKSRGKDYTVLGLVRIAQANYLYDSLMNPLGCSGAQNGPEFAACPAPSTACWRPLGQTGALTVW